ncbi:uncharacterized protein PV06_07315 [Exophiala oligosperma]|uniref:Uncharacterized protein n=1 Tax=Exophiala oligosperma TaxID=215243 RepID=A0A0D2DX75_9EURO|nr:uncharacterized protein PV06_07315 [Exophiala oligosperma]KIW40079.1 hypothetical protein PV06_07315 [Exophiala oligosperma]
MESLETRANLKKRPPSRLLEMSQPDHPTNNTKFLPNVEPINHRDRRDNKVMVIVASEISTTSAGPEVFRKPHHDAPPDKSHSILIYGTKDQGLDLCVSRYSFLARVQSLFNRSYSSHSAHLRQYPLKMSLASSFSFLFPPTSSPVHFSNCSPESLSYFRPPLWLAYLLARVMPIWMNLRVISAPTRSLRSTYDSNIVHRTCADLSAIGTVRKAQYGRIKLLYGSKERTPISPRAISYE